MPQHLGAISQRLLDQEAKLVKKGRDFYENPGYEQDQKNGDSCWAVGRTTCTPFPNPTNTSDRTGNWRVQDAATHKMFRPGARNCSLPSGVSVTHLVSVRIF